MAVCTNAKGCEGYFYERKYKEIMKDFCSGSSMTTKLLAKCALSCLAKFGNVDSKDFKLCHSELKILFILMSPAVKDEDGESNVWPVYTLTTPHYLHCLLTFCYHFLTNEDNAKLLLEGKFLVDGDSVTLLGILNSVLQNHHKNLILLERVLHLLERFSLTLHSNIIIEIQDNYPQIVTSIESLLTNDVESLQQCAFFCLRALDHATPNITGLCNYCMLQLSIN